MKKGLLVLTALIVLAVCACCPASENTDMQVLVGQVWENLFSGTEYEVVDLGKDHIIYQYHKGSYKSPNVKTKKDWLEDYKLIKDVDPTVSILEFSLNDKTVNDKTVEFNYNDGKFDIVYDEDDLTGSAQVFLEAMKVYWRDYIQAEAMKLYESFTEEDIKKLCSDS